MICVKFTAFCDLRADLRIRLATLRKSVRKFCFCKLALTLKSVWPGHKRAHTSLVACAQPPLKTNARRSSMGIVMLKCASRFPLPASDATRRWIQRNDWWSVTGNGASKPRVSLYSLAPNDIHTFSSQTNLLGRSSNAWPNWSFSILTFQKANRIHVNHLNWGLGGFCQLYY